MTRTILLLFLAFALFPGLLTAQQKTLHVKHITSEDGLSDNQVTCVLRDKLGFMWIGTKDGLNRFDGREFQVFRHNENDLSSVCGNNITCLALDDDSLLWIGTAASGFCNYDFRTGKFTSYNKSNLPLYANSFNVIKFDKINNRLWLGLNNHGLHLFDLKTKKLSNAPQQILGNNRRSWLDIIVKDSTVYLSAISSFIQMLAPGRYASTKKKELTGTANVLFAASDGYIYSGMWDNALHEFSSNLDSARHYFFDGSDKFNFSGDEIISIAEGTDKTLWCGTKFSGIHFFDLQSKTFTTNRKFSLNITSRIFCIYRDNLNRMWIGTETGLFQYDPLKNQFKVTQLPVPEGVSPCKVHDRVITKGGKEIIVSTCGLFYKNHGDNEYSFKDYFYNNEKLQLYSIYKDSKERVFIGTNKTIFHLDTLTYKIEMVLPGKKLRSANFYSISSSRVNSIAEITWKNDTFLMPMFYGHTEFLVDFKRKNVSAFGSTSANKPSIYENLVRKLYVDSKNNIWACGATRGIVQIVIPDTVSIDRYFNCDSMQWFTLALYNWENKTNNEIAINDVYDIIEDKDYYWLTTQGSGLTKFYPENTSSPYVAVSGNYKSLQGLRKTGADNLWIISSTGLLNYDIKNKRYLRYDKSDGVSEGVSGYFFNDKSELLSAGFDGGFISFDPSAISRDKEKPSAYVSKLWVMDIPQDFLLSAALNFTYDKNFLKFYISSNCFSNNEAVSYMYFLEGIDDNWRNNQDNPLITYTNLPHGDYILKVKTINNDGLESDITYLPITISPPFYKTTLFYIAVILLVVSAAYGFYRYRISQILKLQHVRNKIARDLHDDIGSTLGSIHLYSQIAASKLNGKKPEEIQSILEKIESSSSEIIDKTGDAVWAVKASNDSVKNLVLRMESYAASILGAAGIHFIINYDEKLADTKLEMTQRKNIFLIYKEAIHNIIKYASCTEVTISISKKNDKMHIIISDNGKGFTMNSINPYNGNGIKNMQSRAEEINGSFKITSGNGEGTSVEIVV